MKVAANVSFSGRICMAKGERRDIADEELLKDLLAAGYVREIAQAQKSKTPSPGQEEAKGDPPEQKEDGSEEGKTDPPEQEEDGSEEGKTDPPEQEEAGSEDEGK